MGVSGHSEATCVAARRHHALKRFTLWLHRVLSVCYDPACADTPGSTAPRPGARGPSLPAPASLPLAYVPTRTCAPSLCRTALTHAPPPRTATTYTTHHAPPPRAAAAAALSARPFIASAQMSSAQPNMEARHAGCETPVWRAAHQALRALLGAVLRRSARARRRRSMSADALPFPSHHAAPRDQCTGPYVQVGPRGGSACAAPVVKVPRGPARIRGGHIRSPACRGAVRGVR